MAHSVADLVAVYPVAFLVRDDDTADATGSDDDTTGSDDTAGPDDDTTGSDDTAAAG